MATTTDLSTLKINYLSQAQYDSAKSDGTLNANELYLTPASGGTGAYMVEFTYDQLNDVWSADKTSQEIYEASEAGQNVVGYVITQETSGSDTMDSVTFFDLTKAHKLVESGTTSYHCEFSVYPNLVTSTSQINYYSYRLVYEDSTITPSFDYAEASTTPTSGDGAMYDSNAKLNSTDMSSADVTSFVNGLNVSGGGSVTTFNMSLVGGVSGSLSVRVVGRIAMISGSINYGSAGTFMTLAGFPSGYDQYKPIADAWLSCDYYSSNTSAEAKIQTNGLVIVSQPAGGNDIKISGTWVTAS